MLVTVDLNNWYSGLKRRKIPCLMFLFFFFVVSRSNSRILLVAAHRPIETLPTFQVDCTKSKTLNLTELSVRHNTAVIGIYYVELGPFANDSMKGLPTVLSLAEASQTQLSCNNGARLDRGTTYQFMLRPMSY